MSERNFKDEYAKFQASTEQKKDRAARNKKRRELLRKGKVTKGDGMDIHHKDGNPRNNSAKNVVVVRKSRNRGIK